MTPDRAPLVRYRLDLDVLRSMLGLEESSSARAVVRAARAVSPGFESFALSLAAAEGIPLGSGARGEVERARKRVADYEDITGRAARLGDARVVKGPSLARYYPRDLVRSMVDLDLVVPDEAALWRVVRGLTDRLDAYRLDVSVTSHEGVRHLVTAVSWPTDDALLDADLKVEVTTVVHVGDCRGVPIRPGVADEPVVADLMALAEERFQHPFGPKDAIDVAVLLGSPAAPAAAEIVDAARAYRLAPELLELIDHAGTQPGLLTHVNADLVAALRADADTEGERRLATPLPGADARETDARRRLARELPVHGLLLRDADRADWPVSRIETFAQGALLLTPLADFVLVGQELVSQELYQAALRALEANRFAREGA